MTATLGPLDVLLIRHAESVPVGTPGYADDDRPLTDAGRAAAEELAYELGEWQLTAIYSSPYARAIETIEPLARLRHLEIHRLDDLRERRLSLTGDDEWMETLTRSWADPDFALPGAESGRDAQRRGIGTLDLLRGRHAAGGRVAASSHGNLIALILHTLEPAVDFEFHLAMPNPAVYRLTHDGLRWRVMGGHGFVPIEAEG
jgi:2,3-bisphosphoglycerate-dependent phosphoglycerate mutase